MDAEEGQSTTMAEDITELRNAADVVSGIVVGTLNQPEPAVETNSVQVAETRPLMQEFEISSRTGDGDELPAYEDDDGSDMSTAVADGFRYIPGSSDYGSNHSRDGSVNDILGPDSKS